MSSIQGRAMPTEAFVLELLACPLALLDLFVALFMFFTLLPLVTTTFVMPWLRS